VDVTKLLFFKTDPLRLHLAALSSLIDLTFLDFFFVGDFMVSLACGSMHVSFALGLVAGNASLSLPTWPVRRALTLGAVGGETTDGWLLGVAPTFVAVGGFFAAFYTLFCLCFSAASFLF
jgi:hypothetical protein